MAAKIPIRLTLFFCGASLLTLAGLLSWARREPVEPYYLEFDVWVSGQFGTSACRMDYYNRPLECDYLDYDLPTFISPDGVKRAYVGVNSIHGWAIHDVLVRHQLALRRAEKG